MEMRQGRALASSATSGERSRRGVEKCQRAAAEDSCLVSGRNRQAAHVRHAIRHAHVEGIIAAEQHPLGARIADQERERLLRVHDGIEVKALERLRRRLGKPALGLLAHVPAVDETPGLVRDEAAAMGEANLELRIPLEYAAE